MTRERRRIALTILVALLFALSMLALAMRARAEETCPTHAAFDATLAVLGETVVGGGPSDDAVVELYISKRLDKWTIIVTDAAGLSCELISGTDWQFGAPLLPGQKGA